MSQIIGIPIFLCSSIFIWFFSCGSWQINQHPALICASHTCQRIRLLSSLYCSLLLHASESEIQNKDGRAWDPGFFLALVSWLISRSRWLVVGARINHTIPYHFGQDTHKSMLTPLDWLKLQRSNAVKVKKNQRYLLRQCNQIQKAPNQLSAIPVFFLKKKETQFKLLQSRTTEGRWLNSHFLNKEDQKLAWGWYARLSIRNHHVHECKHVQNPCQDIGCDAHKLLRKEKRNTLYS